MAYTYLRESFSVLLFQNSILFILMGEFYQGNVKKLSSLVVCVVLNHKNSTESKKN